MTIDIDAVITLLKANVRRWQIHLESTRIGEQKKVRLQNTVNSFIFNGTKELEINIKLSDLYENSLGRYNRTILPFTMKNLRKLPIVGDIFHERK